MAVRVEIHESIARPVEEVFERLVDIAAYPRWLPPGGVFVSCAKESAGPVGEGTKYSDRTRLGTVRGEVLAFNRPREVIFHYAANLLGVRVMDGWPGYRLEPDGERRTILHHRAEGRLHGPFRLLRPLVQRLADRERRRTVEALKRSFESESSGSATL